MQVKRFFNNWIMAIFGVMPVNSLTITQKTRTLWRVLSLFESSILLLGIASISVSGCVWKKTVAKVGSDELWVIGSIEKLTIRGCNIVAETRISNYMEGHIEFCPDSPKYQYEIQLHQSDLDYEKWQDNLRDHYYKVSWTYPFRCGTGLPPCTDDGIIIPPNSTDRVEIVLGEVNERHCDGRIKSAELELYIPLFDVQESEILEIEFKTVFVDEKVVTGNVAHPCEEKDECEEVPRNPTKD